MAAASRSNFPPALPRFPGGQRDILSRLQPALWPEYPVDAVWPTRPPREHTYTRAVNLDHELITPAAVRDWHGAPPMWFAVGGAERGLDGNRAVASSAARSGVPVEFVQYEGMPHEWMTLLRRFLQAQHFFAAWGAAIVDGPSPKRQVVIMKMPDCQVESIGLVKGLAPLDYEEMRRRMEEKSAARPIWTGNAANPKARM